MSASAVPSHTQRVHARRVLVIAPHYDDEVLGCGGLILQLTASGTRVDVMFLTDGAGAPGDATHDAAGGAFTFADGAAYSRRRREESEHAARLLGVTECLHVDLPDSALASPVHVARASEAIAVRIRATAPDLLLAPSPLEISADHRAACAAVHDAMHALRAGHEDVIRGLDILLYEVNHASHPDLLVDVSPQIPTVTAAMHCYASQQARHDYLAAAIGLRRFRTLTLGPDVTHAEAYRRLSGWDLATRSFAQLVALVDGHTRERTLSPVEAGPLVSVVVRTRDRPRFLADALASLAASTYRHVEVVLVNDGGAPSTVPGDYPFPLIRVDHTEPRGRAAAAQAGVDAARGTLIAFLDDDDIVAPEHLATLVDAMRAAHSRVVYSIAAVAVYALDGDAGWTCVRRDTPYARDFDVDRLLVDNYIPLNTLLIERALLAEAGPFDVSFDIFEDWEMLIRLAALATFHYVPRVTCEYRMFRDANGQALGEEGWRRPDFITAKARVLERHAARLTPAVLARAIVGLRADATGAELRKREAVDRVEADSKELRRSLNTVGDELRRVYSEEARLTKATEHLQQRIETLLATAPAHASAPTPPPPPAPKPAPAWRDTSGPAAFERAAAERAAAEATAPRVASPESARPAVKVRHVHAASPIRKASVMLVSWNGREHLETCLDALADQHAPDLPYDTWVLDNGSTDGTVDWLRTRHPSVRVVSSRVNLGFCAGYNRLVAATDADAVVLLNNDTRPERNWLGELIASIAESPADVAGAAGVMVDWSGERLDYGRGVMTFDGHAFQLDSGRPLQDIVLPGPGEEQLFACAGNMIVRRRSFLDAGGFDEQFFAYYDDVDLGWRLWSGGERIISAPRAVARHRAAASSDRLGMYNRGFLFERNAFLTAYKNYDAVLWDKMMPALMLTLISRTTAFLTGNNPQGGLLAVDPFAAMAAAGSANGNSNGNGNGNGTGNGSGVNRHGLRHRLHQLADLLRARQASPPVHPHPIVSDELTVAQVRALTWLTRNMDGAAERRQQVQTRRRRSDADIFSRFPLHLVPTYSGDDVLFRSPGFRSWLPDTPALVFRTLDEIKARA